MIKRFTLMIQQLDNIMDLMIECVDSFMRKYDARFTQKPPAIDRNPDWRDKGSS
jgi:hypothetical protein